MFLVGIVIIVALLAIFVGVVGTGGLVAIGPAFFYFPTYVDTQFDLLNINKEYMTWGWIIIVVVLIGGTFLHQTSQVVGSACILSFFVVSSSTLWKGVINKDLSTTHAIIILVVSIIAGALIGYGSASASKNLLWLNSEHPVAEIVGAIVGAMQVWFTTGYLYVIEKYFLDLQESIGDLEEVTQLPTYHDTMVRGNTFGIIAAVIVILFGIIKVIMNERGLKKYAEDQNHPEAQKK